MTHDDLRKIVETALGKPVAFDARPVLGKFIKDRATKISLRYDWIRNDKVYPFIQVHPEIDMGDGSECITIWIRDAGS